MVGTKLDSPSFQTGQLMVPHSQLSYFVDELYVEQPNVHFRSGWPVGKWPWSAVRTSEVVNISWV